MYAGERKTEVCKENTNVRRELRRVGVLQWRKFAHVLTSTLAETLKVTRRHRHSCAMWSTFVYSVRCWKKIGSWYRNTNVRCELRTVSCAKMTELRTSTLALIVKVTRRQCLFCVIWRTHVCSVGRSKGNENFLVTKYEYYMGTPHGLCATVTEVRMFRVRSSHRQSVKVTCCRCLFSVVWRTLACSVWRWKKDGSL